MGFDEFEKERIVRILGKVQLRMDYVESSIQEVLHKVKLMMLKDTTIGLGYFPAPHEQEEEESLEFAMRRDDDEWMEEEELKFA